MRLSGDYRNHAGVIRVTLRAAPGPPSTVKRVPMFRTIALLLTMLVALAAGVALAPSVAQARYASIVVDVERGRSEVTCVGQAWALTCSSRWPQNHSKKKKLST